MASGERWLAALTPFVRAHLPAPPARVLELGCGPLGGFVPALLSDGYEAVGIDRKAPDGAHFRQGDFERTELGDPVGAIVASRSLHHVGDVGEVLDRVAASLAPGGVVIVAEWQWERFDERSARWCFDRLAASEGDDPGWLQRRRGDWLATDAGWDEYFTGWADGHGLHRASGIVAALDARFERLLCEQTPYLYADVEGVSEQDEQAAIDAGEIGATGIRYVGALRA